MSTDPQLSKDVLDYLWMRQNIPKNDTSTTPTDNYLSKSLYNRVSEQNPHPFFRKTKTV